VLKKAQAKLNQLTDVVREKLPEHQIYLRANGKVRFFTLSTGTQVSALALITGGLLWSAVASWSFFGEAERLAAKDMVIAEMNDRFEALTQDLGVLEKRILNQATELEQRQSQIHSVLADWLGDADIDLSLPDITQETQGIVPLIKGDTSAWMTVPNGALSDIYEDRYASIEARQDGLVTYLRDMARVEVEQAETVLAKMNLSSSDLMAAAGNSQIKGLGGTGGPLLNAEGDISSDLNEDSLEDLMSDWDYLRHIRSTLQSIPSLHPAKEYFLSSKFGRRRDPITKAWAFHSGVDLGVWYGSKVMAPTDGTVTYAGYKSGYGKMVEIDHGNGFKTRFGHLRRITVKKGKAVSMGDKIAESGNTGRSTGPHLHYEIWFKGKPVDPTPYLEASKNVLEIQRRAGNG